MPDKPEPDQVQSKLPEAGLAPLAKPSAKGSPGRLKGKILIDSDFDQPLPPELQEAFDDKRP